MRMAHTTVCCGTISAYSAGAMQAAQECQQLKIISSGVHPYPYPYPKVQKAA